MNLIEVPLELVKEHLANLEALLLDENRELKVVKGSQLKEFPPLVISMFCSTYGYYTLLTEELLELLHPIVKGRNAIEIGAGAGHIAKALGIPASDIMMQDDAFALQMKKMVEEKLKENVIVSEAVKYGPNVERLEYKDAVLKYRPEVVLACCCAHLYSEGQPQLGGSMYGIDAGWLLRHVPVTLMAYNAAVYAHHAHHMVMRATTVLYRPLDALFTRASEYKYGTIMATTIQDGWPTDVVLDYSKWLQQKDTGTKAIYVDRNVMDEYIAGSRKDIFSQPDYSREKKQN